VRVVGSTLPATPHTFLTQSENLKRVLKVKIWKVINNGKIID
jgi:hypothetical protein